MHPESRLIKSMYAACMLLFFVFQNGWAQKSAATVKRSHAINNPVNPQAQPIGSGRLTVIGVMVEFQPDTTRFTTGDGTFDGMDYLKSDSVHIDPLPHNQDYFESHLEFAKRYFDRVSGGKLQIDYRVLPNVYQLDKRMAAYSPTGENFTNEKLAQFIRDVWTKVEAEGGFDTQGLNPNRTAFAIFHAGAGRDIELTGTSLAITPQDLPSLYLSQQNLADLLDQPDFNGFPINDGAFRINSSMILPQTESRPGEDVIGNKFVLELSTNGLVCASIGSHIGLPDLFNIETGNSGIGQFGLMDGAGFFSYSGLFPPEPSAWEKTYMGWVDPFEISNHLPRAIDLPAASIQHPHKVARYSISSDEYYLVENRHRDPNGNGVTLTIRTPEGQDVEQTFTNNDSLFINQPIDFDSLLTRGVVVDASNYDFALPGGLDYGPDEKSGTDDDRNLNGGILIWHIDEAVIDSRINGLGVNTNPTRRGVDLEEADGAQDIGFPSDALGSADPRGGPYDFWWKGNNASVITRTDTLQLYKNRFGPDTRPNNNSNTGARSYFEFYNFSDNLPTAHFEVRRAYPEQVHPRELPVHKIDDRFQTLSSDPQRGSYPPSPAFFATQTDSLLFLPGTNDAYAIQLYERGPDTLKSFSTPSPLQPLVLADGGVVWTSGQSGENGYSVKAWDYNSGSWSTAWTAQVDSVTSWTSTTSGDTLFFDGTPYRLQTTDGSSLPAYPQARQQTETINGNYGVINGNTLKLNENGSAKQLNLPATGTRRYAGLINRGNKAPALFVVGEKNFYLYDPDQQYKSRTIIDNQSFGWPAMTDLEADGQLDILYVNNETGVLNGINANGGTLASFPLAPPEGSQFTGTPLIADIDGDGQQDMIVAGRDSLSMNIYAYDLDGKPKAGFPLYVGSLENSSARPLNPIIAGSSIWAVSPAGDVKSWALPNLWEVRWATAYGNGTNNKVTGKVEGDDGAATDFGVLNKKETYNWPNPADQNTNLRYQVSKTGEVQIRIVSMSGSMVYDRTLQTDGGAPEELRLSTSEWSSGVYFAVVTARVEGREEHKMVKIAIVH